MQKGKLLLIPFFIGLFCLVYSWILSYPLTIDSVDSFVYYNVSVYYWFGLPLTLASTFLLALTSKNPYLKWAFSVGILLCIYSLAFFYPMVPTSDSQYFRGLNEYFLENKNLDPTQPTHSYYQQPAFFILSATVTSVTGLSIVNFEFLLYALIGVLIATCLYVYASKKFNNGGPIVVAAFSVSMFYFFNFQAVPFTLAFAMLLLLFVLETRPKSLGTNIASAVIFGCILITHSFVPLFFILYVFLRSLLDRSKQYALYTVFCTLGYLAVQLTLGSVTFFENLSWILNRPSEYSSMIAVSLTPANPIQIDMVAQFFTRAVTITTILICVVGFLLLLVKKRLANFDLAIFLSGIVYSALGLFVYTLGTRAVALAFIPISLGAVYLFQMRRLRPYLLSIFLILLALFVFVPIRQSFATEIQFQTQEAYQSTNFLINYTNWTNVDSLATDYRTLTYIEAKLGFYPQLSPDMNSADTLLYTQGLGKALLEKNMTIDHLNDAGFNILYDNGYSRVLIK
jgi:hypothetical protein